MPGGRGFMKGISKQRHHIILQMTAPCTMQLQVPRHSCMVMQEYCTNIAQASTCLMRTVAL